LISGVVENRQMVTIFNLKNNSNIQFYFILILSRNYFQFVSEVTRGWRKLHNEELYNFHSSPSIITMMKSRRMRCAGHVERIGTKKNARRKLVGKP
jgi:hypothetical protein